MTLADTEKQEILKAIIAAGSVREAAKKLGISPVTVYRKLKTYGLALKANQILAELRKQQTLPVKLHNETHLL
jgi:molybdenum-dependent DNA-binding transcriptional regulator ModE